MRTFLLVSVVGLTLAGCGIPAEYKCPEGLAPITYIRHNDHAMTGIGRQVEVHTSDLTCGRLNTERDIQREAIFAQPHK